MSNGSPLLTDLIDALRCLPGVGREERAAHGVPCARTRSRWCAPGSRIDSLRRSSASATARAVARSARETVCSLCAGSARDASLLCVVETPVDQLAIEQATGYRGRYFVLLGRLSPLDGLGPKEIGLDLLASRLAEGDVQELIVATNPTVEGEATAHMLAQLARAAGVRASRLAHGVPLGGELEYIDRGTLAHAFGGRQTLG